LLDSLLKEKWRTQLQPIEEVSVVDLVAEAVVVTVAAEEEIEAVEDAVVAAAVEDVAARRRRNGSLSPSSAGW